MDEQRNLEWLIPDYPELSSRDLIGQAAVNGQLLQYPQVVRTLTDPPILGQNISLLSFMLFKEPKKTESGKNVYGFVKNRGNYNEQSQAVFYSKKLIREFDSKFQIKLCMTGTWVPITDDEDFIKEKIDVKMNEEELELRTEAVKEKENERQKKINELEERKNQIAKEDDDPYSDTTTLKYYTMKRVTEYRLQEALENERKKIKDLENSLSKIYKEVYNLESMNPHYEDEWVDYYNEERKKVGIIKYLPSEKDIQLHKLAMDEIKSGV